MHMSENEKSTYRKLMEEWDLEMENVSDEDLVKYNIGCDNATKDMPFGGARCKYNRNGRCQKGAFLTSTLAGSHPADCPIRREKVEE